MEDTWIRYIYSNQISYTSLHIIVTHIYLFVSLVIFFQASEFIHAIGEDDSISPVLPVYNYFLGACAKTRSGYHASKCLELMDQRRVGKNEITYAALLKVRQEHILLHCLYLYLFKSYSYANFKFWSVGDMEKTYLFVIVPISVLALMSLKNFMCIP